MRQSRPQRKIVPGAAPGLLKVPEGAQAPTLHLIAYGSEGFTEGRLDSPGELLALREGWDTVWLDVRGLGDGELLRRFGELFGIHRLALEDVANVPQRPKLETYDQHHFLVIQQVDTEDPEEEEQVTLFVGEGFVLTFQEHEGDWFEGVRERLRVGHGLIRKEGADYLTYALLDAAVDSYFPALEQVGEQLESLEEQIIADATMDLMTQVRRVKRRLMTMRRQAWPQRRVVMIYQPHRYTRTRDLYEDFVAVLSSCDVLVLLDVYPAGEDAIPGADSRSLTRSIRQRGQVEPIFAEQIEDVPQLLCGIVQEGDVVVTQGAGTVARLAQDLSTMNFMEVPSA